MVEKLVNIEEVGRGVMAGAFLLSVISYPTDKDWESGTM